MDKGKLLDVHKRLVHIWWSLFDNEQLDECINGVCLAEAIDDAANILEELMDWKEE